MRLETERARRLQRLAEAPRELRAEPVDAAVLDRVFEARVRAILAVAVVALNGDGVFGDGERVLRRAEADDVGDARERRRRAVRHAHAAADRDVVTRPVGRRPRWR